MNVFEELNAIPNELLTGAQLRRKEKMAEIVSEYNDIRAKYGFGVITSNRICELLAAKHGLAVRTTRYYLEQAGVELKAK